MRLRYIYLFLCLPGAALPCSQFLPWLAVNGLDLKLFFAELFSTHIGAFFGWDVIVSSIVLFIFIAVEGKRLAIPKLWVPVVATLAVGVSFGFPLFLFMRQLKLDSEARAAEMGARS